VIGKLAARTLDRAAVGLRSRGLYEPARRLHLRALRLAERWLPPAERAAVLNNLGVLDKFAGRFAEAEELYGRALALAACDEPSLAAILHNQAGLEHARGDHAAGEPLARRGLEIRERLLGREHPDVASDLAQLAAIVHGLGRHGEAREMLERALPVLCDPAEIAAALNNLGALLLAVGDRAGAGDALTRALAIKRRVLGSGHPDTAITVANLETLRRTAVQPSCTPPR
jgi:tetratricopeptide (TPR) repeat protein